jgi:hypothetical protein
VDEEIVKEAIAVVDPHVSSYTRDRHMVRNGLGWKNRELAMMGDKEEIQKRTSGLISNSYVVGHFK